MTQAERADTRTEFQNLGQGTEKARSHSTVWPMIGNHMTLFEK